MSDSVQMPALGESVTEGTVTRWLKQVGDRVEVDEPLLEVSTDKVDTEIPSPVAGVVQEILVGEDETVAVGAQLAVIGDGSEPSANGSSGNGAATGSSGGQATAPPPAEPEAASTEQVSGEREVEGQPSTAQPEPVEAPAGEQQHGGAGEGQAVTMPALGESVTEGTVTRWLKQVGDEVAVDEPLLEVSTDKVDTEIPAPFAGVLQKILVAEDETVPVGTELAVVGGTAAAVQPAQQRQTQEAPAEAKSAPAPEAPEPEAPSRRPRSRRPRSRSRRSRRPRSRMHPSRRRARPPGPVAPARRRPSRPRPARPRRGCGRAPACGRPSRATPRSTSPRWCAAWPPSTASTWTA